MGKTKKDVQPEQTAPAEQNIEAATPQAETRPDETAKEGEPQSGTNPEGQTDSAVDPQSETGAVANERFRAIADKTFANVAVDVLYFTADGCGFGSEINAEAHACELDDRTIETITRKQ